MNFVVFLLLCRKKQRKLVAWDNSGTFFCSCTALVSSEVNRLSRRQKKKVKNSGFLQCRQSHKTTNTDWNIPVLYGSACSHLSELVNSANLVSGGLQALINQTYKSHLFFRQTLVPIAILCQITDMFLKPPLPTFQNPLMRNEKADTEESISRRAPVVVSLSTAKFYQGFYAIFSIQFEFILYLTPLTKQIIKKKPHIEQRLNIHMQKNSQLLQQQGKTP